MRPINLDLDATEHDIATLSAHYMNCNVDKLKAMLLEGISNKFTCCFKLFMIKRSRRQLTKDDLSFISQKQLENASTETDIYKKSIVENSYDEAMVSLEDSKPSRLAQLKLPQIHSKDGSTVSELLARVAMKQGFVSQLRKITGGISVSRDGSTNRST